MNWNKLSMRDKANFIRLGVRNNLTTPEEIREAYRRYDEGGDITTRRYNGQDITEEQYLDMQAKAINDAAVNNALSRETGELTLIDGNPEYSCLSTYTSNFGKKYKVTGNQTFTSNPEKYGWKVNGPLENTRVGDMYQWINEEGIPYHSTMITGYKDNDLNSPLMTYSKGKTGMGEYIYPIMGKASYTKNFPEGNYDEYVNEIKNKIANHDKNDYVKNKTDFAPYQYETYRFIGTPEDRAKWAEEYNTLTPTLQKLPQVDSVFNQPYLTYKPKELFHKYGEGGPGSGVTPVNPNVIFQTLMGLPRMRRVVEELNNGLDNTPKEYLSYAEADDKMKRRLSDSIEYNDETYTTTSPSDIPGEMHYPVVETRYTGIMNALKNSGVSDEDALRLAPFLTTQMILEGGYKKNRDDNNYGGLKETWIENGEEKQRQLVFDTPEEFYRTYLSNLDKTWGDEALGKGKGWRNAQTLEEYANTINREELGLHTEKAWKEYNKAHPGKEAKIYTPWWTNNNNGLMSESKFGGIHNRVEGMINLYNKRVDEWNDYARKNNIYK